MNGRDGCHPWVLDADLADRLDTLALDLEALSGREPQMPAIGRGVAPFGGPTTNETIEGDQDPQLGLLGGS